MSEPEVMIYDHISEQIVIGCLLTDAEIQVKHLDAIRSDWFFDPTYQKVLLAIKKLQAEGLTNKLERLAHSNGMSAAVFECAAQASPTHFEAALSTVRRDFDRRERLADLERELGLVVSDPLFLAGQPKKIHDFELLDKGRFDIGHPPEKPVPVISLCGFGMSTPGNLTAFAAQMKTAKTTIIFAAIASMMTPAGDCLGFTGQWTGGAWVHFDSEQSPYDFDKHVRMALRRAGRDEVPDWFRSFSTCHLDVIGRRELFFAELERAHAEHGKLSGASLDGVADICIDPNDQPECLALISRLTRAAHQYDCPLFLSLHENPGTQTSKMRGHLGSELARKAESNIQLAKDEQGIITVFSEFSRSLYIAKATGPRFAWDQPSGMFMSLDSAFVVKNEAVDFTAQAVVDEIFNEHHSVKYSTLRQEIMRIRGVKERTAEKFLHDLIPKFCRKNILGFYEKTPF